MICSYRLQGKMEKLQNCLSGYSKYPDYMCLLIIIELCSQDTYCNHLSNFVTFLSSPEDDMSISYWKLGLKLKFCWVFLMT